MILEIITPEKEVFNGEVTSVKFPGTDGGLKFLTIMLQLSLLLKKEK